MQIIKILTYLLPPEHFGFLNELLFLAEPSDDYKVVDQDLFQLSHG